MSQIIIPYSSSAAIAQTQANFPAVVEYWRFLEATTTTWPGVMGLLTLAPSSGSITLSGGMVQPPSAGLSLTAGTLPSPGTKYPLLMMRSKTGAAGLTAPRVLVGDPEETNGSISVQVNNGNPTWIVKNGTNYLEFTAPSDGDLAVSETSVIAYAQTGATTGAAYWMGDSPEPAAPTALAVALTGTDTSGITYASNAVAVTGASVNSVGYSDILLAHLTAPPTPALIADLVRQMFWSPGFIPMSLYKVA